MWFSIIIKVSKNKKFLGAKNSQFAPRSESRSSRFRSFKQTMASLSAIIFTFVSLYEELWYNYIVQGECTYFLDEIGYNSSSWFVSGDSALERVFFVLPAEIEKSIKFQNPEKRWQKQTHAQLGKTFNKTIFEILTCLQFNTGLY